MFIEVQWRLGLSWNIYAFVFVFYNNSKLWNILNLVTEKQLGIAPYGYSNFKYLISFNAYDAVPLHSYTYIL